MATTFKLQAPVNFPSGQINGFSGQSYTLASDRSVSGVNQLDVAGLLAAGFCFFTTFVNKFLVTAPLAADLVSIVNAVTPSNVALTLAAQPVHARKFQVRIVIGTTTTTAITAGTLTLVGTDVDGNAVTEIISLIQNASATVKSANAYASLTSATVAAYAANGSGTGNTVGIGVSNDFAVPCGNGGYGNIGDFTLLKSTKITAVLGTSVTAADDVASTATIDTSARTIAPTTTPSATGLINYEFTYSYSISH
jgi:hypothetical protein